MNLLMSAGDAIVSQDNTTDVLGLLFKTGGIILLLAIGGLAIHFGGGERNEHENEQKRRNPRG